MKKYVLMGLLVGSSLLMASCGSKNSDNGPASGATGGQGNSQATEVTDLSLCQGSESFSGNLYRSWGKNFTSNNGFDFEMIMTFSPNYAEVEIVCHKDGNTLVAKAQSSIIVSGQEIRILSDDSTTEAETFGDLKLTCSAAIKALKMQYAFKGSCLQLEFNGEKMLYRPM